MNDRGGESRWRALLFATLLLVLTLITCGALTAPLAEPDEARYAEIAREMAGQQSWVVPQLQRRVFRDKPPLVFWASASALSVFGVRDWAARLPVLLAALLGVAVTWQLARSVYDAETAMLAAIILATSPLYYGMGQILTLDMPLALWTTLGMAAVWYGYRNRSRKGYALAYAAAGLGVLTKGPVAALLIGVPAAVFFAMLRDGKAARRALDPLGIVLFLLIATPWFLAMEHRDPGYLSEFLFHHHFERFVHPWHHQEPIWFYAPVLLIGLFPWSLLWLFSARNWRRVGRFARPGPNELFLGLFAAFPVVVFSLSSSKLIPYVLPGIPPLAILFASTTRRLLLAGNLRFLRRGGRLLAGAGALTLAVGVVFLFNEFHWRVPLIRPYLFAAGLVSLAFGSFAAHSAARQLGRRALVTVICACVALMGIVQVGRAALVKDFRALGLQARTALGSDRVLWSYNDHSPAMDFYSGREAHVIAAGEEDHLSDLQEDGSPVVLIVRARDLGSAAKELERFRIVGSQGDRVLMMEKDEAMPRGPATSSR